MIEWIAGAAALAYFRKKKQGEPPSIIVANPNDPRNRWREWVEDYAHSFGVNPKILFAIMRVESDYGRNSRVTRGLSNPIDIEGSKSSDGLSWGLMQLTLKTARYFEPATGVVELNDPETSIRLGAKYIAYLQRKFPGDQEKVIRAYNGGETYFKRTAALANTTVYYQKVLKALGEQ